MIRLTDQEVAARKRRNLWIALALVAFMVTVFATTVLRLSQNRQDAQAQLAPPAPAPAAAPIQPEARP